MARSAQRNRACFLPSHNGYHKAGGLALIYPNHTVSVSELRAVIMELTLAGAPSVGRTAGRFGVSSRSLQRHLAQQGTAYWELVESARYELAVRFLRQSNLSVSTIASMLGYSDPSSFSRAFLRWSGKSPRNWRKSLPACAA